MAYKKSKKVVGVPLDIDLFNRIKNEVENDKVFDTVPKKLNMIIVQYYENLDKLSSKN
jgi:hypothetical protein